MIARRRFAVTATGSLAAVGLVRFPGEAAEFNWKVALNEPSTHPIAVRTLEAAAKIKRETGGRMELSVFPDGSLGNPNQLINQMRLGAIQMQLAALVILANVVPICGIDGLPFIYTGYNQAWTTRDGPLGALIRATVEKNGIFPFEKTWDDGMRQLFNNVRPVARPDDLKGLKLRIGAAVLIPAFKALGASPTPIELTEEYTALQTRVVDGAEQPLSVIYATKFYEVTRYLSILNHGATGNFMMANMAAWRALPTDVQEIVDRNINAGGLLERADVARGDLSLEGTLKSKGMESNHADASAFKAVIRKAGLYAQYRDTFGSDAWSRLEKSVGPLA